MAVAVAAVAGLVGVYRAEGSLAGEVRYVLGRLLGTARCALCDITHAAVRRKPAWDGMVAALGVPFALRHLDELDPDVAPHVAAAGSPLVLARLAGGGLAVALSPADLEALDGTVGAFEAALRRSLAARGHALP